MALLPAWPCPGLALAPAGEIGAQSTGGGITFWIDVSAGGQRVIKWRSGQFVN